ncbi:MAG: hypothetical protein QOJ78_446, partial [Pseudonocardiales bacterium]|nr:hypothetical protein [Pseudonocardiales bacterium]
MDVDSFIAQHSWEWQRLDELAGRRRLDGAEADELVALYRQVATHLALVQSRAPDPALAARLSRLLARGRAAAVGTPRTRGWAAFARGLTVDFPVTVYRTWRWSVGVALVSIGASAAMWLWLRAHPDRIHRVLPDSEVHQLVEHDFKDYYTAHPAQSFAAQVWTNNALVAALALFLGVTVLGTLYVLWQNTVNIGLVGGIMIASGKSSLFFGLILPHGLLELTAITIAGAAGLRLGWTVVAPGDRPRGEALAEEGRRSVVIVMGLMLCFVVAGLIEGFVTPSGLPVGVRVGIGVLVELAFIFWIVTRG